MKDIVIAIDGPSAAGKSTVARAVANNLGYVYLDTGAMYRCVALYLKNNHIAMDEEEIEHVLHNIQISLKEHKVFLNECDVSDLIREDEISMMTSKVSGYACVRSFLVEQQRKLSEKGGVVLDGRDIGTVVLPDAQLKIFQIASVETRAKRRFEENLSRGMKVSLEEITKDIEQRDYQDTHREHAPLKKADDAIELDTSKMTVDEVVQKIMLLVKEVGGV